MKMSSRRPKKIFVNRNGKHIQPSSLGGCKGVSLTSHSNPITYRGETYVRGEHDIDYGYESDSGDSGMRLHCHC